MSDIVKIDAIGEEMKVDFTEDFNEEVNNQRVIKKIKEKKGKSFIDKWLPTLFPWYSPKEFNPTVLSNEEYSKKSIECLENCLLLLNAVGWKDEKKGKVDGDIVQTMETDKYGKIYLMTINLECPAEFLFDEFCNKVEEWPKWNTTILESVYIQKINDNTDITYQVTSGGGGGAVKPRDFVVLRHNARNGDRFMSCGTSIEYPGYPPNKKYIRGENKVGCWVTQPLPPKQGSNRVRCKLQWLMCCNLKGWIPQYVLDIAFSTTMLEFNETVRNFIEKKRLEQAF